MKRAASAMLLLASVATAQAGCPLTVPDGPTSPEPPRSELETP